VFGRGRAEERIDRLEERVREQERVIRVLCERAGIDPPAPDPLLSVDDEERSLVARGMPIRAIKHHRERTGSSLARAKRAID